MKYTPKPRVISVRRQGESIEDETPSAPCFPEQMATPIQSVDVPLVVLIRPSWVDMPMTRLAWAFTRAAIAAVPAILLLSSLWRLIHV